MKEFGIVTAICCFWWDSITTHLMDGSIKHPKKKENGLLRLEEGDRELEEVVSRARERANANEIIADVHNN